MSIKRIQKELSDIKKATHGDIPENISMGPRNSNNLSVWDATIIGAVGTPYEGGMLKLSINFPNNYPFVPPIVKFVTKVFHPNIHENGEICVDILKYRWSPAFNISQVLLSILSLLSDPNPDDPLNPEAAHLFKLDINAYNQKVIEYVNTYAN
jgi:ubiquitin-conjugating enzyme E2 D/E